MAEAQEGINKKHKLRKILSVTIAWFLLPFLGIATLIIAGVIAFSIVGNTPGYDIGYSNSRLGVLIGALGINLLVLMVLIFWRFKKKYFIKHTLIGLFIGAGVYLAIGIFGVIGFRNYYSTLDSGACTDLSSQIIKLQNATVPIATDVGFGTAIAINDNTTLITAYHVVDGTKKVFANYVSGEVPIKVIAVKPKFDLALLKISKPTAGHLNLTGEYSLGDPLYVYGFPGNAFSGGQASLSTGIISRILDNSSLKLNNKSFPDGLEMVQTDAAINPGNSGGPVVNRCGVIGIVNSVSDTEGLHNIYGSVSEQGIGYAVSSKTIAKQLGLPISN